MIDFVECRFEIYKGEVEFISPVLGLFNLEELSY